MAYLLREGTQVGHRLPAQVVATVRQQIRSGATSADGFSASRLGTALWRNFWNPNDPLEPFRWATGFSVGVQSGISVFSNTDPQFGYHYGAAVSQNPHPWVHMEIGGRISRHGGGLTRNMYNPYDTISDWSAWELSYPSWHAAIGVPGVKWEIAQAGHPYPEFYWLDPEAGTGTYKLGRERAGSPVADDSGTFRDGAVMRNWREGGRPRPDRGNLAQAVHVKAGVIRYSARFDGDVYRSPIHQLLFEELPAPFGQWGFGLAATGGAAHTRLRFDLFPLRTGLGPYFSDASLRIFFLRFDVAYRNPQTFHLGLGARMTIDSPALRPGRGGFP